MKKIVATFLIVTFIISGCSLFKKDPQKAVNQGVQKFADVKKMAASLSLNGTFSVPDTEEGTSTTNIQFAFDATSKSDASNIDSPVMEMGIKATITSGDSNNGGEVQIKSVDKKLYINLVSLNIAGEGAEAINSALQGVLNTWWFIPESEQSPFSKLTEEQKKIVEQFKNTNFFTNAKEEGQEDVSGIQSTKYSVDLDKTQLKKFIVDIARVTDNQITPEDESAIEDSLKDVAWSGAVWIGNNDGILHRLAGTITITPIDGPASSFDIDYKGWDYGKDVTITAPEGAQEFNPAAMMQLFGVFGSLEEGAATTPSSSPATGTLPSGSGQVPALNQ